ncbi:methyl-accepting chemotaxis protein [Hydrogenophaga sp. R2]|uniref:methyl-accepting chemotaxis protein n=1 Tax=Hydrogenophaga sp. R2 TaxID=3132827 RepID=UPI003CF31BF8
MSILSNMPVRTKLAGLVGLMALAILAVGLLSLWSLSRAVDAGQRLATTEVAAVRTLGDARSAIGNMRRFEKDMFLNLAFEAELERYHKAWQAQVASTLDMLRGLQPQLGGAEQEALQTMVTSITAYQTVVNDINRRITIGEINDPWAANKAMEPSKAGIRAADQAFVQISDAVTQRVDATVADLAAIQRRAWWITVGSSVAAVLLALALGTLMASRIARPLQQATEVIDRMAEGHLGNAIVVSGRDEPGQVLGGLQRMQQQLAAVVVGIRQSAQAIGHSSEELARGNQDLSSRTEQTASNLEETAASMEELTSTVRQSADAARQANQLAASAAEIAARGGEVVAQVVTTMDEINHSSKKINDIIGVIDGIAFQTNILALNAAVEAARAGEQGRGFAVVAGEVRNLAQRSAQAAKEIKGLIGASVDRVEAGSKLVADAGNTMSEIVGSVQRVSDIIGEITAAAGEQSDGIGQVNTAVVQLDQMTQQNAALVEESAAAAESLKDQAQRLNGVVARFILA